LAIRQDCGYVTKQTVPPHQPLPVTLEIYRNTRIRCVVVAVKACANYDLSAFRSMLYQRTRQAVFKQIKRMAHSVKFVFVVHTERLSVQVALFYPCHVGVWDSLLADTTFTFKLLTPGVN
jgi:hypothetical protein